MVYYSLIVCIQNYIEIADFRDLSPALYGFIFALSCDPPNAISQIWSSSARVTRFMTR